MLVRRCIGTDNAQLCAYVRTPPNGDRYINTHVCLNDKIPMLLFALSRDQSVAFTFVLAFAFGGSSDLRKWWNRGWIGKSTPTGEGGEAHQRNEKRYRISIYSSRLRRASLPHLKSGQEPNRHYYFLSEGQGIFLKHLVLVLKSEDWIWLI